MVDMSSQITRFDERFKLTSEDKKLFQSGGIQLRCQLSAYNFLSLTGGTSLHKHLHRSTLWARGILL